MRTSIAFVLLLNLVAVFASFPAYLTRCRKDEPDLNACVLQRAQEGFHKLLQGDESLGLRSYLPLKHHSKRQFGNDAIKFDIENLEVSHINSSRVTDAKWDLKNRKVSLTFEFDKILWDFDLEIGGKFMDKHLSNNGKEHATKTYINGWYSYDMQYEPVDVHGVKYPKVKHGKADYDADTILYSIGDVEVTNAYLNKHHKLFDKILHSRMCEFIVDNITPAFDAVFKVTPIDELFV